MDDKSWRMLSVAILLFLAVLFFAIQAATMECLCITIYGNVRVPTNIASGFYVGYIGILIIPIPLLLTYTGIHSKKKGKTLKLAFITSILMYIYCWYLILNFAMYF